MDSKLEKHPFTDEKEKLYRAVLPISMYWDAEGRVTGAAFRIRAQENGISVERGMQRTDKECCRYILSHLNGEVVYITVGDCLSIPTTVLEHIPTKNNPYHSEISYSGNSKMSKTQIMHLLARYSIKIS